MQPAPSGHKSSVIDGNSQYERDSVYVLLVFVCDVAGAMPSLMRD